MNKYLPLPVTSVLFVFSFVFFYYTASPLYAFTDIYWHLMAGEQIILQGSIPEYDSFSYTSGERDWVNVTWFADILLALLYKYSGNYGLDFLRITIGSIIICMLFYMCLERRISLESILVACFLVIFVFYLKISPRPFIFSSLLLVVFYWVCRSSGKSEKNLYVLPLLMVAWVNLHGGFILGFTILGAYFIEAYMQKNNARIKRFFLIGSLCFLATLVNPYGLYVYEAVIRVGGSIYRPYIYEWSALPVFTYIGITLHLFTFILSSDIRNRKIPVSDKIITFTWFFLGLYFLRFYPVFAILSLPYLCASLDRFKPNKNKGLEEFCLNKKLKLRTALLSSLFLIIFIWFGITASEDGQRFYPEWDVEDEVRFINRYYPDIKWFNYYAYGAGIIFHSNGRIKVFIDGREKTAYPREVVQDYVSIITEKLSLDDASEKYGFNGIIAPSGEGFYDRSNIAKLAATNPNWRRVLHNEYTSIFIKK